MHVEYIVIHLTSFVLCEATDQSDIEDQWTYLVAIFTPFEKKIDKSTLFWSVRSPNFRFPEVKFTDVN